MREKYRVPLAVLPLMLRRRAGQREILLHCRQNTGYADGCWDCAGSGHVEDGEPFTVALAREAMEELGIAVRPEEARFAVMVHSHDALHGVPYVDAYFEITAYAGTPTICEPEKCSALTWFPLDALPENLLPDRRMAIARWLAGERYAEWGWH